jgi:hypothetical protein
VFKRDLIELYRPILQLIQTTGSRFTVNVYPFLVAAYLVSLVLGVERNLRRFGLHGLEGDYDVDFKRIQGRIAGNVNKQLAYNDISEILLDLFVDALRLNLDVFNSWFRSNLANSSSLNF